MENPDEYNANSKLQRIDAFELLSYISSKMTWRINDLVLDFGCGQGYVTKNILLPLVQTNPGVKIYGVDISKKMINFAKLNYSAPSITYMVADLLKGDILIPSHFDKIFSTFVLHWIPNQEQALRRFYEILNVNGEIGLFFISSDYFFGTYEILADIPKWASYLTDFREFIPASQVNSEQVRRNLEEALLKIGYTVQECSIIPRQMQYDSFKQLVDFGISINPFIFLKRIPDIMYEDYREDFRAALSSLISIPSQENGRIELKYSLILIRARK